jgi:hypothetical protein
MKKSKPKNITVPLTEDWVGAIDELLEPNEDRVSFIQRGINREIDSRRAKRRRVEQKEDDEAAKKFKAAISKPGADWIMLSPCKSMIRPGSPGYRRIAKQAKKAGMDVQEYWVKHGYAENKQRYNLP